MKTALLYLSFGGPNGPNDVVDFMANVTRNRPVPRERLAEVSQHYLLFGGKSPINEINLAIIRSIRTSLEKRSLTIPIYFANRNWTPYVDDVVSEMQDQGVTNALVFATSAYGSYSGCRQYRQDCENATVKSPNIELFKLRHFYNHPNFIDPFTQGTISALENLSKTYALGEIAVLYTAHSIPVNMANAGPYESQLRFVRNSIAHALQKHFPDDIYQAQVYQSRSGPPSQPWLEPDISDAMTTLRNNNGLKAFVIVPIGFISDHMEVIYDLDTLAKKTASSLGVGFQRVPTPSSYNSFSEIVVDLISEKLVPGFIAPALPGEPQPLDSCQPDCCMAEGQ